jgi:phosphoenolpyruvate carboxylase
MLQTKPPPADPDASPSADVRLLGRILGDFIREQAGQRVFDLVEGARRRAVAARREGTGPTDFEAQLDGVSDAEVLYARESAPSSPATRSSRGRSATARPTSTR